MILSLQTFDDKWNLEKFQLHNRFIFTTITPLHKFNAGNSNLST